MYGMPSNLRQRRWNLSGR